MSEWDFVQRGQTESNPLAGSVYDMLLGRLSQDEADRVYAQMQDTFARLNNRPPDLMEGEVPAAIPLAPDNEISDLAELMREYWSSTNYYLQARYKREDEKR